MTFLTFCLSKRGGFSGTKKPEFPLQNEENIKNRGIQFIFLQNNSNNFLQKFSFACMNTLSRCDPVLKEMCRMLNLSFIMLVLQNKEDLQFTSIKIFSRFFKGEA